MNGYQIIQQISERSGGLWQPSPGSVYPALAQLEDENLIALQDTSTVLGARTGSPMKAEPTWRPTPMSSESRGR